MGKLTTKKNSSARHKPLAAQLETDKTPKIREQPRRKERNTRRRNDEEEEEFVPERISKKILAQAREQQAEVDQEEEKIVVPGSGKWAAEGKNTRNLSKPKSAAEEEDDLDSDDGEDEEDDEFVRFDGEDVEVVEVDGADEAAIERFMFPERFERRNLAELIMGRIKEKEEEVVEEEPTAGEQIERELGPKIVEVYKQVGKILSSYTSGKLPKAFKIIPSLTNWEQILYVTEPDNWSPVAMRAATRIFASNLNAKMAQRFYNLILLPRVRDDIQGNKKLNYHLYMALKKGLYKPQAWYKGILLPLCEAEMPYSGANSIFMRVLLNKKYSLPRRVIDTVAEHFIRFRDDERELPVLWHQSLLTFAQRYRNDIQDKHKEMLKEVMKKHHHGQMTPEIRRELFGAANARAMAQDSMMVE